MKEICDCESYEGEERRRCERRCGEDRRKENRGGEERRKEDRRWIRKRKSNKGMFLWLLIILFISLVFSALTGSINIFIEKYFSFNDESYRPMDLDRMRYESEKAKPTDIKK